MSVNVQLDPRLFNPLFFDILSVKTRFCVNYGGAGSSKSYSQAQAEVVKALQRKEKILVCRKHAVTLKDSVISLIKDEIIGSWGITHLWHYHKTDRILTNVINGSQIIFRGLDDPEKLKSITGITRVWVEEASECDEKDIDQLNLRLRTEAGGDRMSLTFNPINQDHWLKEKFFDSEAFRNDTTVFKTTYLNNRFCSPELIKQFELYKLYDQYTYDVYALGNWGILKVERPFAHAYRPTKHESLQAVYDPRKPVFVSFDFNIDPFAITFWHLWDDGKKHLHCFDEMTIPNGNIQKAISEIRAKYKSAIPSMIITGDSMGKRRELGNADHASYYQQIQRGLNISLSQLKIPNAPTHENSRADTNYVLMFFDDFKINPDTCPNTCRDMKIVEVDAYGKIKKADRKNENQRADHLDTVRYIVNTHLDKWISNHQKQHRGK